MLHPVHTSVCIGGEKFSIVAIAFRFTALQWAQN